MVSREDVVNAYRFILGRDPENEEVVAHHTFHDDIEHLRLAFINSDEFRARIGTPTDPEMLNGPQNQIDLNATPQQLDQMMSHIAGEWSTLGDTEPYWSVLSNEAYRSAVFSSFKNSFDATGQKEIAYMQLFLGRHNLEIGKNQTCIEYGCGVGRVTNYLSNHFGRVIGCDISPAHLAIAREHCGSETQAVELKWIRKRQDLFELPEADFICSIIVFQHNPPPLMAYMLDSLLKKLKPGGVAFFQAPTYGRNYRFDTARYLNNRKPQGSIEMHVLPQSAIFNIAAERHCSVLEVREDAYINMPRLFLSNTFLLRRNPD